MTPVPIVAVTVPAPVSTLLPRPSDTVIEDTCVIGVDSSATFTIVPGAYFFTGPQLGLATVPAATLNTGPWFSLKLNS